MKETLARSSTCTLSDCLLSRFKCSLVLLVGFRMLSIALIRVIKRGRDAPLVEPRLAVSSLAGLRSGVVMLALTFLDVKPETIYSVVNASSFTRPGTGGNASRMELLSKLFLVRHDVEIRGSFA